MPMVRMIYASKLTDKCTTDELRKILKVSRDNNRDKSVTGILCYDPQYFVQLLEGDRDTINKLYLTIASDERHTDPVIVAYDEIAERSFPGWSMAYLSMSDVDKSIVLKYCQTARYDPYEMSSNSLLSMLMEFSLFKPDIIGSSG